jgi:hypothetical protein
MVINDEAHHTHEEDNEWNQVIRRLHEKTPLTAQLDLSATPRFQKGAIFPWAIFDYPLKQAIVDGIVKRPMKGVARIQEARSTIASVKYKPYLTAGVERWKEYREQLKPLKKKPVLFIMLNETDEAEEVGDWLRTKYPNDFGDEKTLIIHTNKTGEITKSDLDKARKCVFNLVPCGNDFEKTFAKFLDNAEDVKAFGKLPEAFGFAIEYTDGAMNLRNYYPDFVAVDNEGTNWVLETKGQETEDVSQKDRAAETWCENATTLTITKWRYLKIMQKEFEKLHPERLADLLVLEEHSAKGRTSF